jgi:hypothetical protein
MEVSRSKPFSEASNKGCNSQIVALTKDFWLGLEEKIFKKYKTRVHRTGAFRNPSHNTYRFKCYFDWNPNIFDKSTWDKYHDLGFSLTQFLQEEVSLILPKVPKDLYVS